MSQNIKPVDTKVEEVSEKITMESIAKALTKLTAEIGQQHQQIGLQQQ